MLAMLLALVVSTTAPSEVIVDLASLKGQTREQLSDIFPGDHYQVDDWHGWDSVEIYTDEKTGLLSQIVLNLKEPTAEPDVTALLKSKYGLKFPNGYLVTPPAGWRWEEMPGPINTITYAIKNWRARDRHVTYVVITYNK